MFVTLYVEPLNYINTHSFSSYNLENSKAAYQTNQTRRIEVKQSTEWNDWIYLCDSYAIGGLAGGEDKDSFWRVVAQCTAALPEHKPRYVMVYDTLMMFLGRYNLMPLFSNSLVLYVIPSGFWYLDCCTPGGRLPTWHCGVQCFRCWHVWLCLSYSYCSFWHSSSTWGDFLSPLNLYIHHLIGSGDHTGAFFWNQFNTNTQIAW